MKSATTQMRLARVHKHLEDARNFLSTVSWENTSVKALDMAVGNLIEAVTILTDEVEINGNR